MNFSRYFLRFAATSSASLLRGSIDICHTQTHDTTTLRAVMMPTLVLTAAVERYDE